MENSPYKLLAARKSTFSPVSSLLMAGRSLLNFQSPVIWNLEVERLRFCLQQPKKEGDDACVGKNIMELWQRTHLGGHTRADRMDRQQKLVSQAVPLRYLADPVS